MSRTLIPGTRDRHGVAHPWPACTGAGCRQGRAPHACDCPLGATELANDVAPDASRSIQPPPPIERDPAYRARVLRLAVVFSLAAWGVLAALLEFFGASEFKL